MGCQVVVVVAGRHEDLITEITEGRVFDNVDLNRVGRHVMWEGAGVTTHTHVCST